MAQVSIDILPVKGVRVWPHFAPYHYLSDVYRGHHAWLFVIDGDPVAFTSIIRMPNGKVKNAWREHRTVVLPAYQGMGIGPRASDWTAHHVCTILAPEGRYFSKTVHPRLGGYRENSPLWLGTRHNRETVNKSARGEQKIHKGHIWANRTSYAHEYIGHLEEH